MQSGASSVRGRKIIHHISKENEYGYELSTAICTSDAHLRSVVNICVRAQNCGCLAAVGTEENNMWELWEHATLDGNHC